MRKLTISTLLLFTGIISYSQNVDSLLLVGKQKLNSGNPDSAIIFFDNVIRTNETKVQDYIKRYNELSKFTEFEREEKGLDMPKIDTSYAYSYYLRSYANLARKKNNEALDDLNTTIMIDSKLAGAYRERGKLLWLNGQKDKGCMDFKMAITLHDSLSKGLFDDKFCWDEAVHAKTEAGTKLALNQFEEALNKIQIALFLFPDSASYLTLRGKCYFGMKKNDLAFMDFDKAISLAPNNLDALYGRGVAYYMKNKYQQAFDDFSKAITVNDAFADAYLYRAYTCEGMQKNLSAIYDYKQVQRLKPRDPLAYYKSGLLKNDTGDKKGACADFVKAASLGSSEASDFVGQCK